MKAPDSIARLFRIARQGRTGSIDEEARTLVGTPWRRRSADGLYESAEDREMWLFRKLPAYSYQWESPEARRGHGARINLIFEELGRTSRASTIGDFDSLAKKRRATVKSFLRFVRPSLPSGATPELATYLEETFADAQLVETDVLTVIGIRLWPSEPVGARRHNDTMWGELSGRARDAWAAKMSNADEVDMSLYEADRRMVSQVLSFSGCTPLTASELHYMESWLSLGKTPLPYFYEEVDRLIVRDRNPVAYDRWNRLMKLAEEADANGQHRDAERLVEKAEEAIVLGGNIVQFMEVPEGNWPVNLGEGGMTPWLAEIQQHANPVEVISFTYDLEPPEVTRNRARTSQRKAFKAIVAEEEANANSPLMRMEDHSRLESAAGLEEMYAQPGAPASISGGSLVLGWCVREGENFADAWKADREISAIPLNSRQLEAYYETLPASTFVAEPNRPYSVDMVLECLSYSGVGSLAELGDSLSTENNVDGVGVLMGVVHPSGRVVWLNPWASSEENESPTFIVVAKPGSGKTFLAQMITYEIGLQDIPVFFLDPKGDPALERFVKALEGEIVHLGNDPGALDPARYATSVDTFVEIAADHIVTSINNYGEHTIGSVASIDLSAALREGYEAGARCVGRCLDYLGPEHAELRETIVKWARENQNFGLGISFEPRPPLGLRRRFTLVQFPMGAEPPRNANPSELSMFENSAIASQRLAWRAGIEIMLGAGGGCVAGDEAWTFLTSPHAASVIGRLGRKGRSLGVFLMLMTQEIADIDVREVSGYISRVAIGHLDDPREIRAALELAGMDPDDQGLWNILRTAKPERPTRGDPQRGIPGSPAKPATMIFSDMKKRHGVITVEPVTESYRMLWSTNRADQIEMDRALSEVGATETMEMEQTQ